MRAVTLLGLTAAITLLAPAARADDVTAPQVSYTLPADSAPKGGFLVSVRVIDQSRAYPQVYYRYRPGAYSKPLDLKKGKTKDVFEATIPYGGDTLEFYFEAFDEFGNGPGRAGSPDKPFRVMLGDLGLVPPLTDMGLAPPSVPVTQRAAPAATAALQPRPVPPTASLQPPVVPPTASLQPPVVAATSKPAPTRTVSAAPAPPLPLLTAPVAAATPAPKPAPAPAAKPRPAPVPAASSATAAAPAPASGGRTWTWITGGAGLGLLAGGLIAGLAVKSADDAYSMAVNAGSGPTSTANTEVLAAQLESNKALGTKATILTISGGLLAAVSVALFFIESPSAPATPSRRMTQETTPEGQDALSGLSVDHELQLGAAPVAGGAAAVIAGRF